MNFTNLTIEEIQNSTLITEHAKNWAISHIEYLNKDMRIFGTSTKVEKGSDKFDTYILYLAPHDLISVLTLCSGAESAG